MANVDLRPLSLGEILDRTFSLYRRNFVLFLGIAALPQFLVLAVNLAQTLFTKLPAMSRVPTPTEQLQGPMSSGLFAFGFGGVVVGGVIYLVVYVFAQGGTVYAVSELYLGRQTSIGASLSHVRGHLWSLFWVVILNFLAIMGGMIFLIIPGIYVACRLITCVPAALLEDLGARASLERSFRLTKDNAGRAFVIYLLYIILAWAAASLLTWPFAAALVSAKNDPQMMRIWLVVIQVGSFFGNVLVAPILTIATAVFYYDLRVRKEAFDLQLMMNPGGAATGGPAGVPTMLS